MKNASLIGKVASGRIVILLGLAESKTAEKNVEAERLAKRYVKLAREISSHYKVPIPKKLKYRICRSCGNFLVPGVNCNVRVASARGYVAYICECGAERHVLYKKR